MLSQDENLKNQSNGRSTFTLSFHQAQAALSQTRTITLPRPGDQLWIVTDGAVRTPGIVVTLYLSCAGKLHLAGFFCAKNCKVLRRGSYRAT